MPSIDTMVGRMHRLRDAIEQNVIGAQADELERIFSKAERRMAARVRKFDQLITDPAGNIEKIPRNLERANQIVRDLEGDIDQWVRGPGKRWADKTVPIMHRAGRSLFRVNMDVDQVSPALVDATVKAVSTAEAAVLRVGYEDTYKIINTVGDDIGEWFRRETTQAVLEGLPVQGPDSLASRLVESGRLKPVKIQGKNGRIVTRSVSQRANAIARVESAKVLNKTHEVLTQEALGDEAVYINSNPEDDRTTNVCNRASDEPPKTLAEWSQSPYGRPPRLSPFHLCRSILIAGRPEWFEGDEAGGKPKPGPGKPEPVPVVSADPTPEPDPPPVPATIPPGRIQDRIAQYAQVEGEEIRRRVIEAGKKAKGQVSAASAEKFQRKRELDALWKEYEALPYEADGSNGPVKEAVRQKINQATLIFSDADNKLRDLRRNVAAAPRRALEMPEGRAGAVADPLTTGAGKMGRRKTVDTAEGTRAKEAWEYTDGNRRFFQTGKSTAQKTARDLIEAGHRKTDEAFDFVRKITAKRVAGVAGGNAGAIKAAEEAYARAKGWVDQNLPRLEAARRRLDTAAPGSDAHRAATVAYRDEVRRHAGIVRDMQDKRMARDAAKAAGGNAGGAQGLAPAIAQARKAFDEAKKAARAAEAAARANPRDFGLELEATKKGLAVNSAERDLANLVYNQVKETRKAGGPVDFAVRWFEKKAKPAQWRSNATDWAKDGPRIELDFNADTGTVVHEIGHMLEYGKYTDAANDFLNYRVATERPGRLRDLFKGSGYRGNEYGRKNDFAKAYSKAGEMDEHALHYAYYTGKDYSSAFYTRVGVKPSTEIVSMGIEQLYRDPATFAEGDPEFFNFILGVLRGRL